MKFHKIQGSHFPIQFHPFAGFLMVFDPSLGSNEPIRLCNMAVGPGGHMYLDIQISHQSRSEKKRFQQINKPSNKQTKTNK